MNDGYLDPYSQPNASLSIYTDEDKHNRYYYERERQGVKLAAAQQRQPYRVLPDAEYAADSHAPLDAVFVQDGSRAVNVKKWTAEQVAAFVERELPAAVDVFREQNVRGKTLLRLDRETLESGDFGLSRFNAERLLEAIEVLKVQAEVERSSSVCFGTLPGNFVEVEAPVVRYEQLSNMQLMGEGFFGEVFLCEFRNERGQKREVVLKRPKAHADDELDQASQVRLKRSDFTEMTCLTMLAAAGKHPNVVTFVGVCRNVPDTTSPCPVLSYHSGGSLRAYLGERDEQLRAEWQAEPRRLLELLLGMARGLEHVHRAGLVHGDLKTDNVLVTSSGTPRLSDFGLSRHVRGRWPEGTLLPLPHMPPELFARQHFDERSDVWMLGLTFVDTVARRPVKVFENASGTTVRETLARLQKRNKRLPLPKEARASLRELGGTGAFVEQLTRDCLALSPADRVASATALCRRLESKVRKMGSVDARGVDVELERARHEEQERAHLELAAADSRESPATTGEPTGSGDGEIDFSKWQVPETSTYHCTTMLGLCFPFSMAVWVEQCTPVCGGYGDMPLAACCCCASYGLVCPAGLLLGALGSCDTSAFSQFRDKYHMTYEEFYSDGHNDCCRAFWYPDRMRRHILFCHEHGWTPRWKPPAQLMS